MELCPKCGHMTAERNHYNQELICYNRECFWNNEFGERGTPYPGFPMLPCPRCGGSVQEPWLRYPACSLCNRIEPNT